MYNIMYHECSKIHCKENPSYLLVYMDKNNMINYYTTDLNCLLKF